MWSMLVVLELVWSRGQQTNSVQFESCIDGKFLVSATLVAEFRVTPECILMTAATCKTFERRESVAVTDPSSNVMTIHAMFNR